MSKQVITAGEESPRRARPVWHRFVPLGIIAVGLAIGYAFGLQNYLTLEYLGKSQHMLKAVVAEHPAGAKAGFTICYALAVAFSFPAASILTIFGGFLFGWAFGAVLSVIGATGGATALFISARYACRDYICSKAGSIAARLAEGFNKDAFSFLLVLRLAPFVPFWLVNITAAMVNVRLRTFVLATAIGVMPGALAYAWLGEGVGSVIAAAKASGRHVRARDLVTPEIVIALAVLACVALLALAVKFGWKRRQGAGAG